MLRWDIRFRNRIKRRPNGNNSREDKEARGEEDGTEESGDDDNVQTTCVAGVGSLLYECKDETDSCGCANEVGDDRDIE